MTQKVTLIPGDGIGPEVSKATQQVLAAAGADIEWEVLSAGPDKDKQSTGFPFAEAVASVRRNRLALKGPMATGVAEGPPSINVGLRKELDLYANLRPVHSMAGVASRWDNVDVIVVRENTEDLYAGLEHTVVPGVVESLKIITEKASMQIAHFAFNYAQQHGRKLVHAIHKANIMFFKHEPEKGTELSTHETTVTFESQDSPGAAKTKVTMRMLFASAAARDHIVKKYNAIEGGNQTLGRLAGALGKPPGASRVSSPVGL